MKYELVSMYDPILYEPTEKFDFDNPQMDPTELFEKLKETMLANRGVGLAAPQVGIPLDVFVVGHPDDPENVFSVFNPKIVDSTGEEIDEEEGCLSFPGLFVKVKRPSKIRMRYSDHSGETDTLVFEGFTARVIQHEYDHLQGLTYTKRAGRLRTEKAKKQKKKLDKLRKNNLTKYI